MPGVTGYHLVEAQSQFDSSSTKVVDAECPAGEHALSGGAEIFPSLADPNRDTAPIAQMSSAPSPNGTVWSAHGVEMAQYDFPWLMNVTAICAVIAP